MQASDPTGTAHRKVIGRGRFAQAETTVQQRSIVWLRMIGCLGDEDDRIDRSGIQAHLGEQAFRCVRTEIQGRDARGGHATLAEADGLGGAFQRGAVHARGQSVRDKITHDRTRRHGDAREADIGERGVHGIGGLEGRRDTKREAVQRCKSERCSCANVQRCFLRARAWARAGARRGGGGLIGLIGRDVVSLLPCGHRLAAWPKP